MNAFQELKEHFGNKRCTIAVRAIGNQELIARIDDGDSIFQRFSLRSVHFETKSLPDFRYH